MRQAGRQRETKTQVEAQRETVIINKFMLHGMNNLFKIISGSDMALSQGSAAMNIIIFLYVAYSTEKNYHKILGKN